MVTRAFLIILFSIVLNSCVTFLKNTYGEYISSELPPNESLKKIRTDGYYYTTWKLDENESCNSLAIHYFILTDRGKIHRMGGYDRVVEIDSFRKRMYSQRSIEYGFKFKQNNGVFEINKDTLIAQLALSSGGNPYFIATYFYKIISPNQVKLIGVYGKEGYRSEKRDVVYNFQRLDTSSYLNQLIEENVNPIFLRNAKNKK